MLLPPVIGIQHDMKVDEDGGAEDRRRDECGTCQDETSRLDERNDETEDAKHDDMHSGKFARTFSEKIREFARLMLRERQGEDREHANKLVQSLRSSFKRKQVKNNSTNHTTREPLD